MLAVASVNNTTSGLVYPARPRDLGARFLSSWVDVVSWSLTSGSEAVGLLHDGVDYRLVPVVKRVHRVVVTP